MYFFKKSIRVTLTTVYFTIFCRLHRGSTFNRIKFVANLNDFQYYFVINVTNWNNLTVLAKFKTCIRGKYNGRWIFHRKCSKLRFSDEPVLIDSTKKLSHFDLFLFNKKNLLVAKSTICKTQSHSITTLSKLEPMLLTRIRFDSDGLKRSNGTTTKQPTKTV